MSVKMLVFMSVGLLLLYLSFTVGAPFLLALVMAIFLEPLIGLMMKTTGMNRLASSIVCCTLFTLFLFGLIGGIGFKLIAELIAFWDRVPGVVFNASQYIRQTIDNTNDLYTRMPPDAAAQLEKLLTSLSQHAHVDGDDSVSFRRLLCFRLAGIVHLLHRIHRCNVDVQLQSGCDENIVSVSVP